MGKVKLLAVNPKLHSRLKKESMLRGMKLQALAEILIETGLKSGSFSAQNIACQAITGGK